MRSPSTIISITWTLVRNSHAGAPPRLLSQSPWGGAGSQEQMVRISPNSVLSGFTLEA